MEFRQVGEDKFLNGSGEVAFELSGHHHLDEL